MSRAVWIDEETSRVGEPEYIRIMEDAAGRFHATDHPEMLLETIEPGKEDYAGLVVLRRRLEDPPRQRHGGIEDGVIAHAVTACEAIKSGGCRWGDRVEDAEQAMREVAAVTLDEIHVIEIVTGVHFDSGRQPAAHVLLMVALEQRDLDSIDPIGMGSNEVKAGRHGILDLVRTPIAGECRVEHGAEPVQDDLVARTGDEAAVDREVVVGGTGNAAERPAGHQDDAATVGLDVADLLFIGSDHVIEAMRFKRCELVRAGTAGKIGARDCLRLGERAADQLLRYRPVEAHAALRGVHGFGDLEAEAPQVMAKSESCFPVDSAVGPRIM